MNSVYPNDHFSFWLAIWFHSKPLVYVIGPITPLLMLLCHWSRVEQCGVLGDRCDYSWLVIDGDGLLPWKQLLRYSCLSETSAIKLALLNHRKAALHYFLCFILVCLLLFYWDLIKWKIRIPFSFIYFNISLTCHWCMIFKLLLRINFVILSDLFFPIFFAPIQRLSVSCICDRDVQYS